MSSNEKKILSILKGGGGKKSLSAKELSRMMNIDTISLMEALENLELTENIFRDLEGRFYTLGKDLYVTKIELTKKGSPYVIINDRFFYVKDGELNSASKDDKVVVKIIDGDKPKVKVVDILERKISEIVCEVVERNGVKSLVPFKPVEKFDLSVDNKLNHLVDGHRVLVEIGTNKYDGLYTAKIIQVIGHKNEADIDMKSVALNNGFDIEFSEDEKLQTQGIPTELSEEDLMNREDLREETTFTIDGSDTKDRDDALSIRKKENGNIVLKIHIAQPNYYIKPNTPLYNGAVRRGTSVYTPGCVLPMFPVEISNGICSLNPLVDRVTRTTEIEYDPNGKVVRSCIYQSVINSKKKMTYEELNQIFENGEYTEEYKDFENDIELVRRLNRILDKKKNARDALKFNSTETKFQLDENGKVVGMYPRECKEAENIVENCMIAANEEMAKQAIWCNIPFIYRVHDAPCKEKVNAAVDFLVELGYKLKHVNNVMCPKPIRKILEIVSDKKEFPVLSGILLKAMKKAEYSTKNIGHYALGLKEYGHTTSPIRRAPDFIVHTIFDFLDSFKIDSSEFKDLEAALVEICKISSSQERNADQVEEQTKNLKALEHAENNIGMETEGYIEFMSDKVIYVRTKEGLLGTLKVSRNEQRNRKIGDPLSVKIHSVSREKMKIYFIKNYESVKSMTFSADAR